jgi:hypothetical protein
MAGKKMCEEFCYENLKERAFLEDLGVDGIITME